MIESLDAETSQLLIDSLAKDRNVVRLRLIKARTNLAKARLNVPADKLLDIEDRLLSVEFNITKSDAPAATPIKESESTVIDELNMLYSDLTEKPVVRERHVDKLSVDSFQHENLSSELVEMAATIKQNALQFQRKLESDQDLVGTTSDAIQRTAGTMSSVGTRLQQYRKGSQLGWMFYIASVLFIFFSLILGMALIQLFGKW